jgi:uncharacterized protein (TIRG00374 family)
MRRFNIITGLILSVVFIWLTIRGVDFNRLVEIMKNMDPLILGASVILFYIILLIRGERWRVILFPIDFGFHETLKVFLIGAGSLFVLPARMGEFVRPALMARRGESGSRVLATVVFERVLDGLCQIMLFIFVVFFMDFDPWLKKGGYLVTALYTFVLIGLVFLKKGKNIFEWPIRFFFSPFPPFRDRVLGIFDNFKSGLDTMSNPVNLFKSVFMSIIAWILAVVFVQMIMISLGMTFSNGFVAAAFIQFVTSLGMVLPAAPGYIGTFHYFCVVGLTFMGIPKEEALGFAILFHGLTMILVLIPATFYFIKEGLELSQLTKNVEEK